MLRYRNFRTLFLALLIAIALIFLGPIHHGPIDSGWGGSPAMAESGDKMSLTTPAGADVFRVRPNGAVCARADCSSPTLTDAAGNMEVDELRVTNALREINLPLRSWIDCQTNAGADLSFTTDGIGGADALPDFQNSATDGEGFVIAFDADSGNEDQGSEICNNLAIPPDYVSGGTIEVGVIKTFHGGDTEVLNCAVRVNNGALQPAGTVEMDQAGYKRYSCAPTLPAMSPGDAFQLYLSVTSSGTMNNGVSISTLTVRYVPKH